MGKVGALVLAGALVLVGCGDPVAIDRAQAAQMYAEIEVTRQAAQIEATREAVRIAQEAAEWQMGVARNVARKDGLLVFLSVVLAVSAAGLAALTLVTLKRLSGAAQIWALQRADIQSRLVKIDERTMTWPALVSGVAVHQLENGRVLLLDVERVPDVRSEMASAMVRSLVVASRNPEGALDFAESGASIAEGRLRAWMERQGAYVTNSEREE